MSHTPGPWRVVPFVDATLIDSDSDTGYGTTICLLHGREEHLDNARLIAAAPDLLAALASETWLVWSNEHAAWWGPNRCNYYTSIESAGRYSLEEAMLICRLRSQTPNSNPTELIQPSPEWLSGRSEAIAKATGTP